MTGQSGTADGTRLAAAVDNDHIHVSADAGAPGRDAVRDGVAVPPGFAAD